MKTDEDLQLISNRIVNCIATNSPELIKPELHKLQTEVINGILDQVHEIVYPILSGYDTWRYLDGKGALDKLKALRPV